MISIRPRRPLTSGRNLRIDTEGNDVAWEVGEDLMPCLIVAGVTDAVKIVGCDTLSGTVDKEDVWAVRGFALSDEVVASLTPGTYSAEELIEAVVVAGHAWSIFTIASS